MRQLAFYYDISMTFSLPLQEHAFLLRCMPPELPEQEILSVSLALDPPGSGGAFGKDSFGNRTYSGRIAAAHTSFRYTVQGTALRDDSRRVKEKPLPCYRYPSPYTRPTAEMTALADKIGSAGGILAQAERIARAVHDHFTYTPGVTGVQTTAADAFALQKGVCQDYTHVFLALARAAGLTARYVSGLPEGEGASHAWAEVWHDGLWYGFDPTRNCAVDESYLKLCVGRDFSDCPIERGVFLGGGDQTQTVFMKVTEQ